MKLENTFILLVGKSGSGKSAIAKTLEFRGYHILQSYTTRPQRYPDEKGHTFVSADHQIFLPDVAAFTKFDEHAYWATHEQVVQSDIYIIDPSGLDFFFDNYAGNKVPITIYVDAPAWTRFRRMLRRGDGLISVLRRIIHDHKIFKNFKCTLMIRNKNSDVAEIASAIDEEMKNLEELASEGFVL